MSSNEKCQDIPKKREASEYDYDLLNADKKLLDYYETALSSGRLSAEDSRVLKACHKRLTSHEDGRVLVKYSDILFLNKCLKKSKDDESPPVYLHQLMSLTVLELPTAPLIQRSPELESRLERLRFQAAETEYQRLTKNVSSQTVPKENLGQELRKMDSQVTFLLNFFLTVVGAFVFGYKAVEYSLTEPNISLQLTVAVTLATVVFFADVYFIIKEYV